MSNIATVYRFRNKVAIDVNLPKDGHPAYLDPEEARLLAQALTLYAEDVHLCTFSESPLGTFVLHREDTQS